MKNYIVGIGELLWDMLPDGKKIGGAPVNFAYHVSQFGLPGFAISAVGNDALGAEITENLSAKQIDCLISTVEFPTGTVNVAIDSLGIPLYSIEENVAWDNIPFTPSLKQIAENTSAVIFGSLAQRSPVSRATINRFIDEVRANDSALIVFDINLRQGFYTKEILEESMTRCNILKINDEELAVISHIFSYLGTDMIEKCKRMLKEFNLSIIILTCGVNGSYVVTPDNTY
ncbi:MAG: carbohydrate kinase, partial [Paramuribaculum sp.]|nr:carbohydrate kinase [Paramuribaculum sp.]